MKKLFVLFILLMFGKLVAQDLELQSMFSKVYFGVLGGTSFKTLPTAGTSISFEVKSNITTSINAKISLGYSTLYDDNSYEIKSYRFVSFDNYSKYHTKLFAVDRVKYTIIPVTLGAEYFITKTKISPFALFEVGYNFSSSVAEGMTYDGIAGAFDTIGEIPTEYRNTAPALDDGSSFSIGVGVGARYMLTDRMGLNIRYIYRYNDSIVNNNQLLIGLTF
ncbi:MAG: outer membrane beta-barrel protein [Ignavibacteria bacterium]|nr:outer membrane beta-barrel protein [Ignavibacteria bacterium]